MNFFTKQERTSLSIFEKKHRIQNHCFNSWIDKNCQGLFALATGVGKCRLAILATKWLFNLSPGTFSPTILLVVPTEKLRDKNWHDEFVKWEAAKEYDLIERTCYASLAKLKGGQYSLVILDEAHNITENNFEFFKNNSVTRVLSLTATIPKDKEKKQMLDKVSPTLLLYPLNNAVEDGLVNPYDIFIIYTKLDDLQRSITVKTKDKQFNVSEQQNYDFLCKSIETTRDKITKYKETIKLTENSQFYIDNTDLVDNKLMKYTPGGFKDYIEKLDKVKGWHGVHAESDSEWDQIEEPKWEDLNAIQCDYTEAWVAPVSDDTIKTLLEYREAKKKLEFWEGKHKHQMLERMRFIYNLRSKTEAAAYILQYFFDDERTLVFCGSINQAETLCAPNTFHSNTKSVAYDKFSNFEINRLGVVDAVNEGHNIQDVFQSLIVQLNSSDLNLIQRVGRNVRFKEDTISKIWIICCRGTQDEVWKDKALKTFDKNCIYEIEYEELGDFI